MPIKNHKKRAGDTAQCWTTCLKYTGLDQIYTPKKKNQSLKIPPSPAMLRTLTRIRVMKFLSTAGLRSQWHSHFGKAWQTFIKLNIHSLYTVTIPFLLAIVFVFFLVLGIKARSSHMLSKYSTTEL